MQETTRFGTSLFGFKKKDVTAYLEKIFREYEEKLAEKEDEITALKNQCRDVKIKYEDIVRKSDKINEDRTTIAEVLIKAQEKADMIIIEAKNRAIEEKKMLEEVIEKEKEKLVDIKHELKQIKEEILSKLHIYEEHLIEIVDANIEFTHNTRGETKEEGKNGPAEEVVSENAQNGSNAFGSSDESAEKAIESENESESSKTYLLTY